MESNFLHKQNYYFLFHTQKKSKSTVNSDEAHGTLLQLSELAGKGKKSIRLKSNAVSHLSNLVSL